MRCRIILLKYERVTIFILSERDKSVFQHVTVYFGILLFTCKEKVGDPLYDIAPHTITDSSLLMCAIIFWFCCEIVAVVGKSIRAI